MHVVQLIDSLHVGGAEKLQVTFARVAQERGMQVTCISLRQDEGTPIPAELRALGAQVLILPAARMLDAARLWRLLCSLRALRPDVLHTHLTYANILGALTGQLTRIPVVATLHSAGLDPQHSSAVQRLESWALRYGAQRVLAVGHTVAAAHGPRLGGRFLDVIPNAVAPPPPLNQAERSALRSSITGDPARPLLLAVGRLDPLKGFRDLLASFALVRESHPDTVLAIAGGGSLQAELAMHINLLGLAGHALLLGSRNDVPALMAAADIFVSASHVEGLPVAMLEAMAAGLPVVATGVGDVPRVLGEGTGLLVPPRQPANLAAALRLLLDEPERRQALGRAAREHVSRHYSLSVWFERLLVLYREVCGLCRIMPQEEAQ